MRPRRFLAGAFNRVMGSDVREDLRLAKGEIQRLTDASAAEKSKVQQLRDEVAATATKLERTIAQLEYQYKEIAEQASANTNGAQILGEYSVVLGNQTQVMPGTRAFGSSSSSDITRRPPLGYDSALEARAIYKSAFWKAIKFLYGNAIKGPIVEFGSRSGFTSRCLAEAIVEGNLDVRLYLYDSFSGLPDFYFYGSPEMSGGAPQAIAASLETFLPPSRLEIVEGFFSDVLPQRLPKEKISLAHIHCDFYGSVMEVLNGLAGANLLQDGCLLFFDDYNCSRANPKLGERRALNDFLAANANWFVSPFISYGWHGQGFILHAR
jgi:O-methyltransferase